MKNFGEFWMDTGWGCGYVSADINGRIQDTAPIFKRFIGQYIHDLSKRYKVKPIEESRKR